MNHHPASPDVNHKSLMYLGGAWFRIVQAPPPGFDPDEMLVEEVDLPGSSDWLFARMHQAPDDCASL